MILFDQLDDMLKLENNWDGYGAIPVFPSIVDRTKEIFYHLGHYMVSKCTDVYPNPHGTISVEWKMPFDKMVLEIGNNNLSYFVCYSWNIDAPKELYDGTHSDESYQRIYRALSIVLDFDEEVFS